MQIAQSADWIKTRPMRDGWDQVSPSEVDAKRLSLSPKLRACSELIRGCLKTAWAAHHETDAMARALLWTTHKIQNYIPLLRGFASYRQARTPGVWSPEHLPINDAGAADPPPPSPQWFPRLWCGVVVGCFPTPCGVVWFGMVRGWVCLGWLLPSPP